MYHTWEPCSHITRHLWYTHVKGPCTKSYHISMSHVPYKWVRIYFIYAHLSSHVTHNCMCVWLSSVYHTWEQCSHSTSHLWYTHERGSCTKSYHIWMSHVTYEWVCIYFIYAHKYKPVCIYVIYAHRNKPYHISVCINHIYAYTHFHASHTTYEWVM